MHFTPRGIAFLILGVVAVLAAPPAPCADVLGMRARPVTTAMSPKFASLPPFGFVSNRELDDGNLCFDTNESLEVVRESQLIYYQMFFADTVDEDGVQRYEMDITITPEGYDPIVLDGTPSDWDLHSSPGTLWHLCLYWGQAGPNLDATIDAPVPLNVPTSWKAVLTKYFDDGETSVLVHEGEFNTVERPGFVDPFPALTDADGKVAGVISDLANLGPRTKGVVSDGASTLLLRSEARPGEAVTFEVDSGSFLDGTLNRVGHEDDNAVALWVNPMNVGGEGSSARYMAFATYEAPDDFGGALGDDCRRIVIRASQPSERRTSLEFDLCRQPVLLVHGLWSSPRVWSDGVFQAIAAAGHFVYAVSYPGQLGFNPRTSSIPVQRLERAIRVVRRHYAEDRHFVRPRISIVGHSMGGLVSRAIEFRPGYRRPDNYMLGDVQRLITLDTPHLGSKLANLLASNECYAAAFNGMQASTTSSFYGPPVSSAIDDLRDPSIVAGEVALDVLNVDAETKVYTITGKSSVLAERTASEATAMAMFAEYGCPWFFGYRLTVGGDSDILVRMSSQRGDGARGGFPLSSLFDEVGDRVHSPSFPVDTAITQDPGVAARVVQLLGSLRQFTPSGER